MFLITGLGNPDNQYLSTPHNAGFLCVDSLREALERSNLDVSQWENENKLFLSEISKIKKNGELIGILQKPLTYMNLSGNAVRLIVNKYDITNFVLIHDDLDIKLGNYKIQEEKSPKTHNGVLSVENALKRKDFLRVRIGVEDRENRNIPGEEYVIRKYSNEQLQTLEETNQEIVSELLPLILN